MITDQTAGIAACEIAASLEKAAGQEDRSQISKAMLWSLIKTAAGGSPDCVKAGGKDGILLSIIAKFEWESYISMTLNGRQEKPEKFRV